MIAMIEKLIAGGFAYEAEGHVLFDVGAHKKYGELSKRDLREMIAGSRVEVAPYKKAAQDFVLWKPSDAEQPGWDSPWGRGRPGWHIECSAMAEKHLGETIDIHAGGMDLVFPHHENECAQSSCAHGGAPFARYWLHNGFLSIDETKMSKSLGPDQDDTGRSHSPGSPGRPLPAAARLVGRDAVVGAPHAGSPLRCRARYRSFR
jgi:cysteinyl-tRNA synthetase